MNQRVIRVALLMAVVAIIVNAVPATAETQYPESFQQAKDMAAKQNKPILMEFFRADCIYCELSKREAQTQDTMKTALQAVVHFPVDVKSDVGMPLDSMYAVGNTYPVFVLANADGDVITRWTGYSNAAMFAASLKMALADQTTIKQRYANLEKSPSQSEALRLAKYNEEFGANLEAVRMYRLAQSLNKPPGQGYAFNIFQNTAQAAWSGKASFNEVLGEADNILKIMPDDKVAIPRMVQMLSNVARRMNKTSELEKYLKAGIDIASQGTDQKSKDYRAVFVADRDLYISHDTTRAINVRKAALGAGWENSPDKYFSFAKWCLERRINLDEAELYARKAVDVATPGKFRASILSALGDIYNVRGKTADAVATFTRATQDDPENDYYSAKLDTLTAKLNK